jgi:DNA ligase (NAD+)
MEIKEKIIQLTNKLNEASRQYYTFDNSIMSDFEYDKLLYELIDLENQYPEYKLSNSPSSRIGSPVLKSFTKVTHKEKMFSLSNLYSLEELSTFILKLRSQYKNLEMLAECKIDGLAINLEYEQGQLARASTRGNGSVGEDVTSNVKTIKSIPLILDEKLDITIRGEVFMTYSDFNKLNNEKEALQKDKQNSQVSDKFANPRNAASGTLRQLDSSIVAKRGLSALFYQIVNPTNYGLHTQEEILLFIKKIGLPINNGYKLIKDDTNLEHILDYFYKLKQELDYPTDGIVFKVNQISLHEELGFTSKYPKWAIAYKFAPDLAITTIEDIIVQVGRTGVLTPVAILKPVDLSGSKISKATLHNFNYIQDKDLRIGDTVEIHKAAEIIPEVIRYLIEYRTNQTPYVFVTTCPSCGSQVVYNNPDTYCLNPNCEEKNIASIVHFASRNVLDIDGLGYNIVKNLYVNKFITNILDIYYLKDKIEDLKKTSFLGVKQKSSRKTKVTEGSEFTEISTYDEEQIQSILLEQDFKRIYNLINSIEESKKAKFHTILFGLGISNVGLVVAKLITKHYPNINLLIEAKEEELLQIHEIGPIMAKSIVNWFKNDDNLKIIEGLKQIGFNLSEESTVSNSSKLLNQKIVITGSFTDYTRNDLSKIIEDNGGHVSSSVSSNTNYLLMGANPGSKYDDALKLNIKIISLDELFELIN